ncbi:MAG: DUF3352 domain-containing protein [Leptolyngbyaceae bacterium]|nr:DUF3352 domain-containing protein [Leptolyngbyaceae bacterium]
MKRVSLRNILLAVVAVVLVGAISIAVWIRNSPTSGAPITNVSALPETALLVPQDTPFMVSTVVNLQRLEQAGLGSIPPNQRRQVQQDITQLKRQINTSIGLDYDADLASWAGDELTLALTSWDVDRNLDNGATPGYLLGVSIGDAEKADSALQQLWRRQSRIGELMVEEYSGVAIRFPDAFSDAGVATTDSPLVATAQIGQHYVLFSNSPNVLRNAVNTLQANQRSLGSSVLYNSVLSQLPAERVALVWVNVPEAQSWWALYHLDEDEAVDGTAPIEQEIQADAESLNPPAIANAEKGVLDQALDQRDIPASQAIEIVATNVAIAPGGLLADTMLTPTQGNAFASHTPQPLTTLANLTYIPADSSFFLAGHALSEATEMLNQFATHGNPLAQRITAAIANRQAQLPLGGESEPLDWATGEYAIARVPAEQASPASSSKDDADWVFVIPAAAKTQTAVAALDSAAQERGLNVDALQIDTHQTTVWTELMAELHPDDSANPVSLKTTVSGIHAEPDDDEVFATSVNAMGKALLFTEANVSTDERFQGAIATLNDQNDGYLFVEWELAQTELTKAFPAITPFLKIAQPLLDPLRSLMLTRYENQPEAQRLGTVLQYAAKDQSP